jgi:hypothetical protein
MKWLRRFVPALIVILLAVVVFSPPPGSTRWMKTLEDSAHGPVFGFIALLLWGLLRMVPRLQRWAAGREYIIALLAAIALGGLSELAQIPTGRDASWMDWRNDVLGTIGALALVWAFEPRPGQARSWGQRGASLAVVLGIVAILATPLALSTLEYRRRDASFPVLADFTSDFDRYFIEQGNSTVEPALLPAPWSTHDRESAMLVKFLDGDYPGIAIIETPPDWRAYASLALDLTNPTDTELRLRLRVHDVQHNQEYADRYNTSVAIAPHTRSVVRVALSDVRYGPATRLLDIAHVEGVVLFRLPGSQAEQMYFSRAWLESATPAVTAR